MITSSGVISYPLKVKFLRPLERIQNNFLMQSKLKCLQSNLEFENKMTQKYVFSFFLLPVISYYSIPFLLQNVADFNLPVIERQSFILSLLLLKRFIIYTTAASTVEISGLRSAKSYGGLGERLSDINSQIFTEFQNISSPEMEKANSEFYSELNKIDGNTQAVALPLFLSAVLLTSYAMFNIQNSNVEVLTETNPNQFAELFKGVISKLFPFLSSVSTFFVCFFFTKVCLFCWC